MLFCIRSRNASSRLYKENRKLLTLSNAPKNLQTIASFQRDITKDYPIAKPLKYLTTRSHRPLPQKKKKRGDPSSSPLEQASYCWVFGCSCMGFLSDGMSMSARETIFNRTAPRDQGVTWSSRSQDWTVCGNVSHVRGTAAFRYTSATEQSHEKAAAWR